MHVFPLDGNVCHNYNYIYIITLKRLICTCSSFRDIVRLYFIIFGRTIEISIQRLFLLVQEGF